MGAEDAEAFGLGTCEASSGNPEFRSVLDFARGVSPHRGTGERRERETLRHDADNAHRRLVESDLRIEDVLAPAEVRSPGPVAEDRDLPESRLAVFGLEGAAS